MLVTQNVHAYVPKLMYLTFVTSDPMNPHVLIGMASETYQPKRQASDEKTTRYEKL